MLLFVSRMLYMLSPVGEGEQKDKWHEPVCKRNVLVKRLTLYSSTSMPTH